MMESAVNVGGLNAPLPLNFSVYELPTPLESVAPVKRGNRIASLDVLRGFALLGILVANIEGFAGLEGRFEIPIGVAKTSFVGPYAHLNLVILFLKWIFIEDKMRGLFAMLFGAGVVLLTERIERSNAQVNSADIFFRRNMWLFVFGVLHGTFIWDGDILAEYAFNALFFLYPCRKLKAKTLFIVGTIVWIGIGILASSVAEEDFEYLRLSRQMSAITAIEKSGTDLTPEQNETKKQWQALIAKSALLSTDEANARAAKRRKGAMSDMSKIEGSDLYRI